MMTGGGGNRKRSIQMAHLFLGVEGILLMDLTVFFQFPVQDGVDNTMD